MRLAAIVGPTATGKTRLAVEVAHEIGSEIISVDSRQVYRGLDIGSGKDLGEYRAVAPPVAAHLVDIADPAEVYTVFHYQRDCYRVLAEAVERSPFREGTPMVMAGGTGLYLEAVIRGFRIPDVAGDEPFRSALLELDREEVVDRLWKENPRLAVRTDLSSRKRVVRALEISAQERSGPIRYSDPPPLHMEPMVFVVDTERPELHRRIDARLDERLGEGLVEEVRGLLGGGLPRERLMQLGLEYREVTEHLTGEKSYDRMVDDLRRGIRLFAKRQQTWFRGLDRRGVPSRRIGPGERDVILTALAKED